MGKRVVVPPHWAKSLCSAGRKICKFNDKLNSDSEKQSPNPGDELPSKQNNHYHYNQYRFECP